MLFLMMICCVFLLKIIVVVFFIFLIEFNLFNFDNWFVLNKFGVIIVVLGSKYLIIVLVFLGLSILFLFL